MLELSDACATACSQCNGEAWSAGKISPHTHKGEKEICYILEGQGLYTDNDRQIPVKAGDVTVDGERHGCSTTDRKT